MDTHERFKRLYKKFVEGTRWLNHQMQQGAGVTQDKREFEERVLWPMEAVWAEMTDAERRHWNVVQYAVKLFNGRVL